MTIVLDIFHVLEYLWKAGHALALRPVGGMEGRDPCAATKRRLATRKRAGRPANYLRIRLGLE